jgi:hypothetical protein
MGINFLLIPFSTYVDYQTYFNTTIAIFIIHMIFNMRLYTFKDRMTHMLKVESLCENYTPREFITCA